ncbi:hypothetical protein ABK040_002796 [Willaertia magna]
MNPSETTKAPVVPQQQTGGLYHPQQQQVFVQYPSYLYPQLYNNNNNLNNGQLPIIQGGMQYNGQYPVIYQQPPTMMMNDNISVNQPMMDQTQQQAQQQSIESNQSIEDTLRNVGSKCCKGGKCLKKFKEQFTKENAKKSINILSLCLLGLLIVLFTYIGAYYYDRPPVWVSILAALGIVCGIVGQLARNHVVMGFYFVFNLICFIYVCTVLWSTRTGICFAFLLIAGIKAAEFTKVYYEEYKAKRSQQDTTTMYDATNQPTAVNTQNNVEGSTEQQQI